MLDKRIYSGSECNNYLYLSFDADSFDTNLVSKELNIEPTSVMIKKDPVPKSTSWQYRIDVGQEIDLETQIENLLALFENKTEEINLLKTKFGLTTRLQLVIDIDINPDTPTPYFGLNKRTIDFLSKTETEVDFDIYKIDTIGVFNRE